MLSDDDHLFHLRPVEIPDDTWQRWHDAAAKLSGRALALAIELAHARLDRRDTCLAA